MKHFPGIYVAHYKYEIFIFLKKYINDVLKDIGKLVYKPTSTRIDPNHKLEISKEDTPINNEMHQKLVGKLIYLLNCSCTI